MTYFRTSGPFSSGTRMHVMSATRLPFDRIDRCCFSATLAAQSPRNEPRPPTAPTALLNNSLPSAELPATRAVRTGTGLHCKILWIYPHILLQEPNKLNSFDASYPFVKDRYRSAEGSQDLSGE